MCASSVCGTRMTPAPTGPTRLNPPTVLMLSPSRAMPAGFNRSGRLSAARNVTSPRGWQSWTRSAPFYGSNYDKHSQGRGYNFLAAQTLCNEYDESLFRSQTFFGLRDPSSDLVPRSSSPQGRRKETRYPVHLQTPTEGRGWDLRPPKASMTLPTAGDSARRLEDGSVARVVRSHSRRRGSDKASSLCRSLISGRVRLTGSGASPAQRGVSGRLSRRMNENRAARNRVQLFIIICR